MKKIGTLSENSLHAGIKQHLLQPGDLVEHTIGPFVVDIVRGDELYEIQVKNLYALRRKLDLFLPDYRVHVVYPIPAQKWIIRQLPDGSRQQRRKSPKHGTPHHVFEQAVYLSTYLGHPNFTLDVLMVEQEDVLVNDGKGSWRRKGWSLSDQYLLRVTGHLALHGLSAFCSFLPDSMPFPFRTSNLSAQAGIPIRLAQKMVYTLTRAGLLQCVGKVGRANLYDRVSPE